ncbi:hypothetical protein JOM56_009314 [Amanita muscaria]
MALQVQLNARFDIPHPHTSKSSFNIDRSATTTTTTTTTTESSGPSGIGTLSSINGAVEPSNTRKPKANRRRRSVISFFLPQNETSSGFTLASPASLPLDIILTIGSLVSPSTLLNLVLASPAFYDVLLPSLYRTLVLPSSDHCLTVLPRFNRRKPLSGTFSTGRMLCSYIRELVLKPNYYLAWPRKDRHVDENWVAGMVENFAKKGWLANLESFEWEGLEVPRDEMWEALRFGCPRLKRILTVVGARSVGSQSKLFDFSNLTSFSIIVRHHIDFDSDTTYPTGLTPLPSKFWDMINTRCSQTLSELQICSFSPGRFTFDVGPLFPKAGAAGTRFPKLTYLTLGVFGYQSDYTVPSMPCMLLGEFLADHPSITYLRVLWNFKRWLSPDDLPFFPPSATALSSQVLPKLDTFVGAYQQLASIPLESRRHIHTIDLTCEPLYELRAQKAWEVLKTVQGLKVLDVWIYLPPGGPGEELERSERIFTKLVDACTGLEEMHFMCTTPLSMKLLDQFLHCLSRLTSLRRFSLTKGHVYRQVNPAHQPEESMFDTAVRVLRACKGVKTVSVRYAREKCLNHLKKEGTYEVIDANAGGVILAANETGISLLGRPYEKRYRRQVDI